MTEATSIDPTPTEAPAEAPAPTGKDATAEVTGELIDGMPAAGIDVDPAEQLFEAPRVEKRPDGKPNRTTDGKVRQARGAKPKPKNKPKAPDSAGTSPGAAEKPQAVTGEVVNPPELQARIAAETLAETLRTVGTMMGGDEWAWKSGPIDERETFVRTWEAYFVAVGSPNLPAWIGPAMVTSQYIGSRMHLPRTREATLTIWGRLKAVATRLYLRWKGVS